jgi:hypothetical protein
MLASSGGFRDRLRGVRHGPVVASAGPCHRERRWDALLVMRALFPGGLRGEAPDLGMRRHGGHSAVISGEAPDARQMRLMTDP